MSINIMAHNLAAMNAERMTGVNSAKKGKTMERLSSGYRINRAADDAAGLAISEGMRRMIRGLNQGTANAKDGISWVEIGDGSLNEAHAILHRMTELTVKSLNGTYTDSDRAMMQVEFEQLQTEIDRLTDATRFNEKHIFADHEVPYYQFEGNIKWRQDEKHVVKDGSNNLIIDYQIDENSPVQTAEIKVPAGTYTTQELVDEIDTALEAAGLKKQGLVLEYTKDGYCNMNIEGGVSIDKVSGGLEYLVHGMYEGGSAGALIGTTIFKQDTDALPIYTDVNDKMSFDIVKLDGNTTHVDLTIPGGKSYTRQELIDLLNNELSGTTVKATTYGQSIKLESDDSIITKLKGNMFKVDYADKGDTVATSVFYDNIGYGEVEAYPAVLEGGAVLMPSTSIDKEHQYYHIDDKNDTLSVQPNDSVPAVTLKIPHKDYTAAEMRDVLNGFFQSNGWDMKAEVHIDTISGRQGLKITSNAKGPGNKIGIDPASSAYDTLFVTRAYNQPEKDETYDRDKVPDSTASYRNSKAYVTTTKDGVSTTSNLPVVITAGQNDKFILSINDIPYEITMAAGKYDKLNDLTKMVKNAIDKAADKLSDAKQKEMLKSVAVTTYSSSSSSATTSYVMLSSDNKDVKPLRAYASVNNTGFQEIFTTSTPDEVTTATGTGSVVLDTPVTMFPVSITAGTKKLVANITAGNKQYTATVEIPPGEYADKDTLLQAIRDALPKEGVTQKNITFNNINTAGHYNTYQPTPVQGNSTPKKQTYSSQGDSDVEQGEVATPTRNIAAHVEFKIPNGKIKITDKNKELNITVNGVPKKITLDKKNEEYTLDELKEQLQDKLNDAFGTGFGGVTVSTGSGNTLKLEANLIGANGVPQNAKFTNISCSTDSSSFLADINTQRAPAELTLEKNLKIPAEIKAGENDTFIFHYKDTEKGIDKDISLTLTPKRYTSYDMLASEINTQIANYNKNQNESQKIGVTASIKKNVYVSSPPPSHYENYLKLSAATPGIEYAISYDSTKGSKLAETIFNGVDAEAKPATAEFSAKIQDTIIITNDNREFIVGSPAQKVDLAPGTYSRASFVAHLNTKLQGVTASLNNDKLTLTTTATGAAARLTMTYAGGGSAMKAIFGTEPQDNYSLRADFVEEPAGSGQYKLELKPVNPDGTIASDKKISVSSNDGSIFQQPKKGKPVTSDKPTAVVGYHSEKYAYMQGAPLEGNSVTIDKWNKDLTLYYYAPYSGSSSSVKSVSITLDEKEYTFSKLQEELQNKLDAKAGQGTLKVEVSSNGVKIMAGTPGSRYYFPEKQYHSGGFYYNVICRAPEKKEATQPTVKDGYYDNRVYAMGRKDIRHNGAEITKGVNDTLTLDFTYGTKVVPISLTITPGTYSGSALVKELRNKLNEALKGAGLPENLIEVGIGKGDIPMPVKGANDDALVFRLSEKVKIPQENVEYRIDGIGGNAAFSIFYQSDGDMKIAYAKGSKDISKGLTMPKDSDMSFDVDGVNYTVTVPAGTYSAEEIAAHLNTAFKDQNMPVTAQIEKGNIQITHTKYGKHSITNVTGDAKRYLFFEEKGGREDERGIWIRLSGVDSDGVTIERPVVNTVSLGINSIAITRPKYANKALSRLKEATVAVSGIRTMFGTMQNRLEHKVNSNENAAENTQAAESAIRDADIAEEIMSLSVNQILEQVSQSMLAQANQSKSLVLSLLQ